MDKLISWLEGSFAPKMNKVVENPWILTIKNSVMQALPLIFLYNGKRGGGNKYFFYLFYPLHLLGLYLFSYLL